MVVCGDGEQGIATVTAEHSAVIAVGGAIDAVFERVEVVSSIRTGETGIVGVVIISMAEDAIGARRASHAYGQTRKADHIIDIISIWTSDAVIRKAVFATGAIGATIKVHIAFEVGIEDVARQTGSAMCL